MQKGICQREGAVIEEIDESNTVTGTMLEVYRDANKKPKPPAEATFSSVGCLCSDSSHSRTTTYGVPRRTKLAVRSSGQQSRCPPGKLLKDRKKGEILLNKGTLSGGKQLAFRHSNTAVFRQRPSRTRPRSAISPLPHSGGQGPLNRSWSLCARTQRTNRRRESRRGWTRTLLARVELNGWPGPCL